MNNPNITNIPFDDDFVKGHVKELLDLEIDKFTITFDQMSRAAEILELKNNTAEQLQAKRNSVVKLLTDDRDDEAALATMSGVTCVIDTFLIRLGRPV